MCYLALLAETFKQKSLFFPFSFIPPPLLLFFSFPWHLQSHPSMCGSWPLAEAPWRTGLLFGEQCSHVRPSHILLSRVSHAVDTARAHRGASFITVPFGGTANFCLSYNRLARVEPYFVALLRGFSGQVSPQDTNAAWSTVPSPGHQQLW